MAVKLELRYRGLRAPHKFKFGVSGCARECAEARGKDVGVIATDNGWNIYVGGNGGFQPVHAQLLASDVDDDMLIRYIDRYMMYYIRTADRLQRTARWMEDLDGGLDHVRDVVVHDILGIADDLEAAMAKHVDGYEDEWAATLRDPERLKRFTTFVNAPGVSDPTLARVSERGQLRPATESERTSGATLVAGTRIPVRGSDA
jgi:nitrite reductase (NADH) large subunit